MKTETNQTQTDKALKTNVRGHTPEPWHLSEPTTICDEKLKGIFMTPPPPCGCKIKHGGMRYESIEYCPLHTNAPALRDALEAEHYGPPSRHLSEQSWGCDICKLLTSCRKKGQ